MATHPALRRVFPLGAGAALLYLAAIGACAFRAPAVPSELGVVFGNALTPGGQPSPRLRARLETARRLFEAGLIRRVIVSGGIEQPGDRDEAAAMQADLVARGVPAGAIVADPAGHNTWATARDAAALAPDRPRVVVVTQWFHVVRATLAMRRAGFRHVTAAWPRYVEWRDIYSLLREAVALPVMAFRPAAAAPPRPLPPPP